MEAVSLINGRGNLTISPAAYTSPSTHMLPLTTTSPRSLNGRPDSLRKSVAGTTPTPAIRPHMAGSPPMTTLPRLPRKHNISPHNSVAMVKHPNIQTVSKATGDCITNLDGVWQVQDKER